MAAMSAAAAIRQFEIDTFRMANSAIGEVSWDIQTLIQPFTSGAPEMLDKMSGPSAR